MNRNIKKNILHHSIIFKIISFLFYLIVYPLIFIWNKIWFSLKIEKKENLPKAPYIFVANHVNDLDCTWIALAQFPKVPYYLTLQQNFEIPVVKYFVMLLRGIPIPKTITGKQKMIYTINELMKNKQILGIYPEGELIPYCNKLRDFKAGTFKLAVQNNVPIVPMVIKYREVKGIRKLLKRKPFITVKILKPIYEENAEKLKNETYNEMNKELNKNIKE